MKNKGINYHRIKDNPLEGKFAKAWEEENTKSRSTLSWLLAKEINKPKDGEVSDRDREVAATVIQWLGSPVGSYFVKHTLGIEK